MAEPIKTCPIGGIKYEAEGVYLPKLRRFEVRDSSRTFYGYRVSEFLVETVIKNLSAKEKARLITWIIDQGLRGDNQPEITRDIIASVWRKPLPVHSRADRLLKYLSLASSVEKVGQVVHLTRNQYELCAWSESTDWSEVDYFLDYLVQKGWLEDPELRGGWKVTVEGHSRVEELQREENLSDSSQVFVAMWFDESMTEAFEHGIRPAIEESGYNPLRIDRKEHVNKIDDEIIAELRRSRFIVADFTHGEKGVRGGVYYEAGFAHGLNLPVIFTCHRGSMKTLHFDTNHYNHIVWTTPAELRDKLKNRILAVIS